MQCGVMVDAQEKMKRILNLNCKNSLNLEIYEGYLVESLQKFMHLKYPINECTRLDNTICFPSYSQLLPHSRFVLEKENLW